MKCPKCGHQLATQDWVWNMAGTMQVHSLIYQKDPGYMHRKCLRCGYQIRRRHRRPKQKETE